MLRFDITEEKLLPSLYYQIIENLKEYLHEIKAVELKRNIKDIKKKKIQWLSLGPILLFSFLIGT